MLTRRVELRNFFAHVWQVGNQSWGPVARIHEVRDEVQATWREPFVIHAANGNILNLLDGQKDRFLHLLRDTLRSALLAKDSAFKSRQDMQGGSQLDYDKNIQLLRYSVLPEKKRKLASVCNPPLSVSQQATLRNIMTGTTRTQTRLCKSKVTAVDVCPWCDAEVPETLEHFFWECSACETCRQEVRPLLNHVLHILPTCFKYCGLMPKKFWRACAMVRARSCYDCSPSPTGADSNCTESWQTYGCVAIAES